MKLKPKPILINLLLFLVIHASSIFSNKHYLPSSTADFQIEDKPEKLYTVKRNESLWKLAGKRDIFNNPYAWPILHNVNRDLIKDPNSIHEGLIIKIPDLLNEKKIKYDKIRDNFFKVSFSTKLKRLLKNSKQFLIVVSKDWDSTKANLIYYEKINDKLLKMSDNIPVNLGCSGLGWGDGMIDFNNSIGPIKHEKDCRSPAGIFKLSYAFGYLPADSFKNLKYPYRQVTTKIECVDDTNSIYYNTLVNTEKINKTWTSSEIMQSQGNHYKYGIFVDHNSKPRIQGSGSCIFIHVWAGFGKPTSGCTSMSEEQIVKLLFWLEAKKNPLLIQLPEIEFNKIRSILNL